SEILNGSRQLHDVSNPEFDLAKDLSESDAFFSRLELIKTNLDNESVVFAGIVSCVRTGFND
ncbi:MAG: hypothetical protein AAGI03_13415, partial [Pseudomonadota bacterium]